MKAFLPLNDHHSQEAKWRNVLEVLYDAVGVSDPESSCFVGWQWQPGYPTTWSSSPSSGTGRRRSNGQNLKSAAFKSERRHLVWNEGSQPLEHVRKECSGCLSTLSSKQGVNFSSGEMWSSYGLPGLGGEIALSEWMMDMCKCPACAALDQSVTECVQMWVMFVELHVQSQGGWQNPWHQQQAETSPAALE